MVEISRLAGGSALAFFFAKTVTQDDLGKVIEEIDQALQQQDKISILCDLVDFESLTPQALLADLMYGIGSLGRLYRFERLALVADSAIWKTLVEIENHLMPALKVKAFASRARNEALSWVQQPIERTPSGVTLSEVEDGDYIRVDVKEQVSGHDIRRVCCAIVYRYESRGPVRLLIQLGAKPQIGAGLLYEKLKAMEVLPLVDKYAVVAPGWAKTRVRTLSGLFRTRMRYFPADGLDQALEWFADRTPSVYIYPLIVGHTVAVRLVGKVTEREVQQLYYLLTPYQDYDGGIDLLLEVPYDEGSTLQGIAESVRVLMSHHSELAETVRRVAVVTDNRWVAGALRAERLLTPGIEERTFAFAQRAAAEEWLAQGRETPEDIEALANVAGWDAELA